MKYNQEQFDSVKTALVHNPIFDNLRMWVEDGQLTEEELNLFAKFVLESIPEEK